MNIFEYILYEFLQSYDYYMKWNYGIGLYMKEFQYITTDCFALGVCKSDIIYHTLINTNLFFKNWLIS